MARLTREQLTADGRSDEELVATAMIEAQLEDEQDDDSTSGAFAVLLRRSGPELLQRAIRLTESPEWMERELGVDLLGQLPDPRFWELDQDEAWRRKDLVNGYLEETMTVLLSLAQSETYPDVVNSLAWAFGNREDPRGIAPLTRLASHEAAHVREAVVHSLPKCWPCPNDDTGPAEVAAALELAQQTVAPLVALAADPDGDIRDWALFGLHGLEIDTPEIRETFLAHVEDPHHDAMTEALFGLANLGDRRGVEPLRRAVEEGGENGRVLIEACELYGDERLVPGLQALRDDDYADDDREVDAALATCRPNLGWRGPSMGWWRPPAPSSDGPDADLCDLATSSCLTAAAVLFDPVLIAPSDDRRAMLRRPYAAYSG